MDRKPDVTVVAVFYNMPREAPRTLFSLSGAYQRNITTGDYEVIAIDNGSTPPLDPREIEKFSGNFRLIRVDEASQSPARAINQALKEARGEIIGVMIDGARVATPGLVHFARHGVRLYDKAVVATLGWYLGPDLQWRSIEGGYDREKEDALLESIGWPHDGYRLFEIGTMDESSVNGWLKPISESNALFLRREFWEELGGMDERFDAPGGGLVNLDTFNRAVGSPGAELVILLGEATFHQLHGGTNTNSPLDLQHKNWTVWGSQYESIRGGPWEITRPKRPPTYIGTLPKPMLPHLIRSANDSAK